MVTEPELRIRSRRVLTPRGVLERTVVVRGHVIDRLLAPGEEGGAADVDLGERWLLPGLVDSHVHVNDPGRAEWEGFETATRAAAAGGVTTIVDMPLNSIPATVDVAALEAKRAAARGRCAVDVAFWGGVVPGNARALQPLAAAGVAGFKCFLAPSGVEEFAHVEERDLREAMPIVARLGLPLLAHAELPAALAAAEPGADPRRHGSWLASRPPAAEVEAIRLLVRLAAETGCRVHVVHLAAAEALPILRAARAARVPITVETCPHYLAFAAEEIPDGATAFKCAPPIRGRAHREALWEALAAGDIDLVASDHSPAPPALKALDRGDFLAAWGGIASLEIGLAAVATAAAARGIGLESVVRWMSERPAALAGLGGRKGAIAPGMDADLVDWDPAARWTVDPVRLRQRHPLTPYAGLALSGRVRATWVRGRLAFGAGAGPPAGVEVGPRSPRR